MKFPIEKITRLVILSMFGSAVISCSKSGDASSTSAKPTVTFSQSVYATFPAIATTITPTVTGTLSACTISPALPSGLSIAAATCVISGTAAASQTLTLYTITATSDGGSATATISLIVRSTTASRVYGQLGSFTTNAIGTTADNLLAPYNVAADTNGVYIADTLNNRVLYFSGASTTATRVYGQPDFTQSTANNGGTSATSLANPQGVAVDTTGVYIADTGNSRVLYYAGTSTTATRVYNQSGNFATVSTGTTTVGLSGPNAIALSSSGLFVSDTGNHRVLFFPGTTTTATVVYGQAGVFTTGTANNGSRSANSLNNPTYLFADSTGLYVTDQTNNRVLHYSGTSTTADRVYGQNGNFTTNATATTDSGMNAPGSVAADSGGVFITEQTNTRIMYYPGTSTTATVVYGQAGSFTSALANNGGRSASSLNLPRSTAVILNAGVIVGFYVVDASNQRVLYY